MATPVMTPAAAKQLLDSIMGSMLYVQGVRRGFDVSVTHEAVVLTYRSESARAINVPRSAMQSLQKLLHQHFPGIDADVFYGYCETVRRKQGLASRWKSIQEAQKANKSKIIGFEILDADPARRGALPANPRDIGLKPAKELPRMYTWIQETAGGEYIRHLICTEHQFGDIRPDEVIVRYKVQPAELNLIKSGTSFKSLPQSARVAIEVTIHVGDVNQQIYGAALKEHFEKTMRGLETVLGYLIGPQNKGGLGFQLSGRITCSTTDSLLNPGAVKLNLTSNVLSHFRSVEPGEGTSLRATVVMEVDAEGVRRVPLAAPGLPDVLVHGTNVNQTLLDKEIAPEALALVQKIAMALAKHMP